MDGRPDGAGVRGRLDRIIVLIRQLTRDEDDDEDLTPANATVRVAITRPQAVAFIEQGTALVSAGRPLCVLCGSPIDPEGFGCACWN